MNLNQVLNQYSIDLVKNLYNSKLCNFDTIKRELYIALFYIFYSDGAKVNIDNLKTYIKGTQLESNLMEFCNFIDNDIEPQQTKDYLYSLKQIIEMVIGNKSKTNKYIKN